MPSNPTKSDYDIVRKILSGVPDTRLNRGARTLAKYRAEEISKALKSLPARKRK